MDSEEFKKFSSRRPLILGLIGLAILVVGFGSWAVFTELSGAIIASGRIEVDQNRQVVQHLDGGVVDEIMVDEGDLVEAGDVLMRLDATRLASELSIVENQLSELMARRSRLEAERDGSDTLVFDDLLIAMADADDDVRDLMEGQVRLHDARRTSIAQEVDQLTKRSQQIDSQIDGIDAQQVALEQQLVLIEKELADQQQLLDKGLAQASRVLALQREQSKLSGQVGTLIAQRAQAEGRTTEIELEVIKLQSAYREEAITQLRDLQYRELELRERRRALTDQVAQLDLRAPVSGVVYGMTVTTPRSVIRPAEPVLYLIPQDRPLIIAAQVPTIHIDQVYLNQAVTLRFSALDQRETPELNGEVIHISADTFQDEGTLVAYYRAEVALNAGELARLPAGAELLPGMPAEAFIATEARTPLAYLIKPLADYFAKAFRES